MPRLDRRRFLAASAAALATTRGPFVRSGPLREALRVGVIGVGNRGAANLGAMRSERVVALCDVDQRYLDRARERHAEAATFRDFREMLETAKLDAVVVSTPDHTHAPAAARALRRGLPVYCEKPLTHTVEEARLLRRLSAEKKVATQMGTQIHAGENYHRVVHKIRAGAVGAVREVHVFCSKSWSASSMPRPEGSAPAWLDFDLWLGGAAERPFTPGLHPGQWRRYWEFGGGTLGDMGAHYLDLAWWALGLRAPSRIEAEGPAVHALAAPAWMHVTYQHQEVPSGPVTVHWWDGGRLPAALEQTGEKWRNGVLFLGEQGWLLSDYGQHILQRKKDGGEGFAAPSDPRHASIGHHREWLEACRERRTDTSCAFSYSGRLTEAIALGIIAYRRGEKLVWDGERGRLEDASPAAQADLKTSYRDGWRP